MLLDKGYFDYDYEKVEKSPQFVDWVDTIKTDEEVVDMLSNFGFSHLKKKKPETTEEIQNHIIKQIKED